MTATGSAVLDALYKGKRVDAKRLADGAALSVFEAAALGRTARLEQLLDGDPALANGWAPDGHTPLGLAAFFADRATAALLLDRGANVTAAARNDMRVHPLHAAIASRRHDTAALLLSRGADVNARQQMGYTPLMGAASAGRQDLVDLLLSHGADPTLRSDDGKTAADVAREHGHHEVARRLG